MTSHLRITTSGISSDHARWHAVAIAVMGAVAWWLESDALGWIAAVLAAISTMAFFARRGHVAEVHRALASGRWVTARLSDGVLSGETCWEVVEHRPVSDAASAAAPRIWWTSVFSSHFPDARQVPVEVCDLGHAGLVIRRAEDVLLVRVLSRRPGESFSE